MGYRSEVMICLKKENFEELQKRVRKIDSLDKDLMEKEKLEEYRFYKDDNVVVFGWNDLKWYSDFEIVKTVQNYLYELSNEDIDYKLIRIGEDYGDIEIQENYNTGICEICTLPIYRYLLGAIIWKIIQKWKQKSLQIN